MKRLMNILLALVILVSSLDNIAAAEEFQSVVAGNAAQITPGEPVLLPLIINGQGDSPLPFTYTIDPTIQPDQPELPGFEGGPPRPLVAIADPDGVVATFVANEIILQTDDSSLVNAVLAKYAGQILLEIDAAAQGVPDLPKTYLIRVDVTRADLGSLTETLNLLDGGENGKASGEHRISSEEGARLLAIASTEARQGSPIGVNWVGTESAIPDSTREAPTGPSVGEISYSPDAYHWSYFAKGTVQDIGVPEAWSLLHTAGKLSNRVKIAVLDMGFAPDADLPAAATFISVVPGIRDARNVRSLSRRRPWHGTHVFGTLMAQTDNGFGVAGVAGPIGEPILVFTTYDYAISIAAIIAARVAGARIINMSYGTAVPAALSWSVLPFQRTTVAVRHRGTLLFAAAGNENDDVDAKRCAVVCWEKRWHTPCENNGVICIGGLAWNDKGKHPESNFGKEHVDIFAPYTVYGGADPDNPGAGVHVRPFRGTSFASPYAAGVAALIWAADPELSADQVWEIMKETAHTSPDEKVERYVNVYAGVLRAIGAAASATLVAPGDGSVFEMGLPIELRGRIDYVTERADLPLTVRWRSQPGNRILDEQTFEPGVGAHTIDSTSYVSDLNEGEHTISVTAMAGDITVEHTVRILVRNSPPRVEITQPAPSAEFCQDELITLRGIAADINEPDGLLDDAYTWHSDRAGALGQGPTLSTRTLRPGRHTITLRVTDSSGLSTEEAVVIEVLSATDQRCIDLPPTARIISPAEGAMVYAEAEDDEGWYATIRFEAVIGDREDELRDLTVYWSSDVEGGLGFPFIDADGRTFITVRLHIRPEDVVNARTRHVVTVRVTDTSGNRAEDRVTVFVKLLV